MYVLDFVNTVRKAQGRPSLSRIPGSADPTTSALEAAMGCELETGLMRFSRPDCAWAVAASTGLPLGVDRISIALPAGLQGYRPAEKRSLTAAYAV